MVNPLINGVLRRGFSPTSIPNLSAWWDASDETSFTYSSGVVVATWTDKSPNKWVLAGTGNKPDRIASGIGGKPAVEFVAADSERLSFTPINHALLDPQTGGFTAIVVLDAITTPAVFGIINKGNDTGSVVAGWSMYGEGGSANVFRTRLRSNAPASASQSVAINTNAIVLSTIWSGTDVKGYINNSNTGWTAGGGGATLDTYTGSITSTADFRVGVLNPASQFLDGRIAEIILYKRVLTTQERAAIHIYLNGKYGIVA